MRPGVSEGRAVGIVTDGLSLDGETITVYRELLSEEGFPYRLVNLSLLKSLSAAELEEKFWVLVFPEGSLLPPNPAFCQAFKEWVQDKNGKILLIYNGGSISSSLPLPKETPKQGANSFLLALAGLGRKPKAPSLSFAGFWFVPSTSVLNAAYDPGVLDQGKLRVPGYPPAQSEHLYLNKKTPDVQELAFTHTSGKEEIPLVTLRYFPRGGAVFFVNARLGYLKAFANDDFLARVPLKFFLIDVARVPRLVATPLGSGGLVLNLHLCARRSIKYAKELRARGLFSTELPLTISVTAGPDILVPGDRLGVDATGRSKVFLQELAHYGSLGSQGGWRHTQWGLFFEYLSEAERQRLIRYNWKAMSKISPQPVLEYAAPNGRHSRSINNYLAELGYRAEAFPAAFNSPPTRPWFTGQLDHRLWLFGYSGTKFGTCPEDMLKAGRTPAQIVEDVKGEIIDQAIKRREIRLFYTHPDSLARYPEIGTYLKHYLFGKKAAGLLTVRTMGQYASFLDRHQAARFAVYPLKRSLRLEVSSPLSLEELTFALPFENSHFVARGQGATWVLKRDGPWLYATILNESKAASLTLESPEEAQAG